MLSEMSPIGRRVLTSPEKGKHMPVGVTGVLKPAHIIIIPPRSESRVGYGSFSEGRCLSEVISFLQPEIKRDGGGQSHWAKEIAPHIKAARVKNEVFNHNRTEGPVALQSYYLRDSEVLAFRRDSFVEAVS